MINVGSVGQPRDGDPRACYVILEDGIEPGSEPEEAAAKSSADEYATIETPVLSFNAKPTGPVRITYRRLPYDHETTIRKIYDISELEPFLGDRLRQGR
jgi:diadenosine tetraphosphatase ApaH/serine/threonine PP2A family protein phosphatase